MSTTKFEHVIGRDGLHRLRLTAANGEIIDNSHEGFSDGGNAWRNLRLKLAAYLELGGMANALAHATATSLVEAIYRPIAKGLVPTVDERAQDPLEPQTQE